jgi:renalase
MSVAGTADNDAENGDTVRMPTTPRPDVLVIGAGIAGVTAARALQRAGERVETLEKSRGVGGRTATRTLHGVRVDHGAQFFTARDPRFEREVAEAVAAGVAVRWADGLPTWRGREIDHPATGGHPRYACPDGMTALAKHVARDLDVTTSATVSRIAAAHDGWRVEGRDGRVWHTTRIVLTAPVPQALALVDDVDVAPDVRASLEAIAYAPCWTIIAGYADFAVPAWPALRFPEHPDLALVANDASRRRHADHAVLVLHATATYTRRRFDAPAGAVADDLLRAAAAALPWAATPNWVEHQRWRYARPETQHDQEAVVVAPGLVLAGDGFGGDRVEGAYLSGLAAAAAIAR